MEKRNKRKDKKLTILYIQKISQQTMATEASDLTPLLEQLEDSIDDIEEVLEPLLERGLTATAQKLPLLDKAKLHVLLSYSIESLIFCMQLRPFDIYP